MATALSFFDTTPTNLVADLKAKILLSSDWSNPAGDRVVCTTTRNADMVVDLADAAATAAQLQFGVYRTLALADKQVCYVAWRTSGGATSDPLHCIVSAGKEHLWITVEGPRIGEANPVSASFGSYRTIFFLGDVVPYFAGDATPTVLLAAASSSGEVSYTTCRVGRNRADNASWVLAKLCSFEPPHNGIPTTTWIHNVTRLAENDSKIYLFPFVIFEDVDGLRGRIAKVFNVGVGQAKNASGEPTPAILSRVTYSSETFVYLPTGRGVSQAGNSSFGMMDSSGGADINTVVAVPWSA